jgi:single-stranded-DNA-specific exonuclease
MADTTQTEFKGILLKRPEKKWILPEAISQENLSYLLNIKGLHPVVAELLWKRGIKTEEELREFFNPDFPHIHDPFLMKDMDKAVSRLEEAMENGERIMVFGDYDVDGTTATALVYRFLSPLYSNLECYIPDRYQEGYGISIAGIDKAKENGVSLIIALDCGIKAIDKVEYASKQHIDFIICDHHLPGEVIPEAAAVLDPKRDDCPYPYKELSGCGVGFKLMEALSKSQGWELEPLYQQLELLAISIGSDIVPITGENRVFMHLGLHQINHFPSPGVEALIQVAGFKRAEDGNFNLKVDRLVFGLGPRINAAGRVGHGLGAVNLLISKSVEEAIQFAGKVDDQNIERKELDKTITQEALGLIYDSETRLKAFSTVLYQSHWHKGVIGIVASRCIEQFYRPTIILTESNGVLAGSGRSIFGFDLYKAIEACSEHLIQFGGHFHAAGLTLKVESFEAFQEAFELEARKQLKEEDLQPRIFIDAMLPLSAISQAFFRQIQRMEPFGPGNMNPLFAAFGVKDSGFSRFLENKNGGAGHIKFSLTHPDLVYEGKPYALEGIGFGLGDNWDLVCSGGPFDIVFHLEENHFRDRKSIQLLVKDIKPNSLNSITTP